MHVSWAYALTVFKQMSSIPVIGRREDQINRDGFFLKEICQFFCLIFAVLAQINVAFDISSSRCILKIPGLQFKEPLFS